MDARPRFSLARRRVLAAGLGAMALATFGSRDGSARVILLRGMSGGGLAQLEGSEEPRLANFGLFASSMQLPEGTSLVLGAMQWLEAGTDLQLQSIEITQCIPSDDRASAAEVRGRLQVNGEGDYPFVVWATDGGRPARRWTGSRSRSIPRPREKARKGRPATTHSSTRQRGTWSQATSSGSSQTSRSERPTPNAARGTGRGAT